MITRHGTIICAIAFVFMVMTACMVAADDSYVHGPVYNGTNLGAIFASEGIDDTGTSYEWDYYLEMNATNFAGFYYNIDDDVLTEVFRIYNASASGTGHITGDRTIDEDGMVYTTTIVDIGYESSNLGGTYPTLGLFGEKYVPIRDDDAGKLANFVIDDNIRHTLRTGESLYLGSGFTLTAKEIDVGGDKVLMELSKDGKFLGDEVVDISAGETTWTYERDDVAGEDDVTVFMVHVIDVFQGAADSLVVEGMWLIDYTDILEIETGYEFGELEVTTVGTSLVLSNSGPLTLTAASTVDIADGLKFKVAEDPDYLRFYLVKEFTEPGIYEIRGTAAGGSVAQRWDYSTFSGFFYDLDNNVASETLTITEMFTRTIPEGGLTYTTIIDAVNYESSNLEGTYQVLGLFGEKYVPLKDYDAGKLAKLFIDDDTNHSLKTGESLYLGSGFTLTAKSIDVGGNKVRMELSKEGEFVKDEVIDVTSGAATWTYERDDVAGEDDVTVFRVHVTDILGDENLTIVEGIWLIDYTDIFEIEPSDEFGELEVYSISDSLLLHNSGSITLAADSTVDIADGLKFKVADDSTLRYYPFMEVTIEGLSITDFSPWDSTPESFEGDSQEFDITTNQVCNVTWTIDDIVVKTDNSVTFSSYENSSALAGSYDVKAIAQNEAGTDTKYWNWMVRNITAGIELCPGWHFISVPCELCDPGVDHVLECVTYDALTCYNTETCSWETVSAIEPLKGYWIHIPADCGTQVIPEEALEPAVTPYTQATQIFEGWNAIGCCESADGLSAELSLSCIDDCYTCIFGPWDPVTMSYEYFGHNGESGLISGRHIGTDAFEMERYQGYWVYATSDTVLVESEVDLIDILSEIDAFHPPASDDPKIMLYNEWHYFNVVDEEQNLSFVTTLKLNGDIYDLSENVSDSFSSHANVLLSYHTPAGANITIAGCPMTQVEYSDVTPDLRVGNSDITLKDNGYEVHIESCDGQTVFDAVFEPECEPAPFFSTPYEPDRVINWRTVSPKMEVEGTLTINKGTPLETTYILSNSRGYHDHNWGYWLWEDDIGWKWGQASEGNAGKYTFCIGNVTNNNHTESKGSVLNIWENEKIIAEFRDDELDMQHYMMSDEFPGNPFTELLPNNTFPLITVINAVSDDDGNAVSIEFNTEYFAPIPISTGENQYLVIWEVFGTYDVNGYVDGNPVSYTTKGFLEYVA